MKKVKRNNMKYIDADLLRKEIERRIKKEQLYLSVPNANNDERRRWIERYREILAFIDSLPEQPVEGLEEEIERYIPTSLSVKFPTLNIEAIKSDIRYIARHFAEWGAKHLKK